MPTIDCTYCKNAMDQDLKTCSICLKPNEQYIRQKPLIEMITEEERNDWLQDAKDGKIMRII